MKIEVAHKNGAEKGNYVETCTNPQIWVQNHRFDTRLGSILHMGSACQPKDFEYQHT